MIVAVTGSPHPYTVVQAPGPAGGRWVAPGCGCGWRGTPVDPTTLGTRSACFAHLRWPYIAHRS